MYCDSTSPDGIYLNYRELDMTLSTVAACMAVAEIASAEIDLDNYGDEEWLNEMDHQMSAISRDSAPWRDRLEDLFVC